MREVEVEVRRWGGSFGVILPKEISEKERISEGDRVIIEIKKARKAKEFFGLLKNWKKPTQKIKDEMRKGWE